MSMSRDGTVASTDLRNTSARKAKRNDRQTSGPFGATGTSCERPSYRSRATRASWGDAGSHWSPAPAAPITSHCLVIAPPRQGEMRIVRLPRLTLRRLIHHEIAAMTLPHRRLEPLHRLLELREILTPLMAGQDVPPPKPPRDLVRDAPQFLILTCTAVRSSHRLSPRVPVNHCRHDLPPITPAMYADAEPARGLELTRGSAAPYNVEVSD